MTPCACRHSVICHYFVIRHFHRRGLVLLSVAGLIPAFSRRGRRLIVVRACGEKQERSSVLIVVVWGVMQYQRRFVQRLAPPNLTFLLSGLGFSCPESLRLLLRLKQGPRQCGRFLWALRRVLRKGGGRFLDLGRTCEVCLQTDDPSSKSPTAEPGR